MFTYHSKPEWLTDTSAATVVVGVSADDTAIVLTSIAP